MSAHVAGDTSRDENAAISVYPRSSASYFQTGDRLQMMTQTLRRPAIPGIALDPRILDRLLIIDDTDPQGTDMQQVRAFVAALQAGGNTAIYSALAEAYRLAAAAQAEEPGRYYSIVLMSDGENNSGMNAAQFADFYRSQPAAVRSNRTFTVVFGKADRATMDQIATTGGRTFDDTKDPLDAIFKQIRGYQ